METELLFWLIVQREKQNLCVTVKLYFENSGMGYCRHFVVTPLNVSFSMRLVVKRYKILSIIKKMSENNMT